MDVPSCAPSERSYLSIRGTRLDWDDLVDVAKAGCDAALVATALHNGRIGAAEVTAAREL